MNRYEDFFNEKAFREERPIIEYEDIEPEIDDDLCICDFDKDSCPVHNNQINEED